MMIEERATIIALENDFAWVEGERQSSCGSCAASKGCGTATLQKVMGNKRTRLKAINQAGAQIGDKVVIGLQEQALLKGSLYAYILPLFMLLAGALLFELVFVSEGMTILGGLGGLMLGFVILQRVSRRVANDASFQAVVLRRDTAVTDIIHLNHK